MPKVIDDRALPSIRKDVEAVRKSGKSNWVAVGRSVHVRVQKSGSADFMFVYSFDRQRRELPLGPWIDSLPALSAARKKADDARLLVAQGIDPKAHEEEKAAEAARQATTFGDVARQWLAGKLDEPTSKATKRRFRLIVDTYLEPLHAMPINDVEASDIIRIVKPLWSEMPDLPEKIKAAAVAILSYAYTFRKETGRTNPPPLETEFSHVLKANHRRKGRNHAALAWAEVPAFVERVLADKRTRNPHLPLAVVFTILTGARHSEVRMMRWREIDTQAKLWLMPDFEEIDGKIVRRSKNSEPYRRPLSDAAVAILDSLKSNRNPDDLAFRGKSKAWGGGIDENAMNIMVRRNLLPGQVAVMHGFRASFSTWALEEHFYQEALVMTYIAHKLPGSQADRAYMRPKFREKLFELAEEWSAFVLPDGFKTNIVRPDFAVA